MAYIDGVLSRGEQIMYVARQHIFVLVSHVLTEMMMIGLLVAAGVASNLAFDGQTGMRIAGMLPNDLILLICVLLSVGVLISGLIDYVRWNTEQYIITDRRVIQVRGIVNKSVIDSSLEKINDLELRQSLLGRMFDYGTIEILTAAGDDGNVLDRIAEPMEFKKAMLEAKHRYSRGYDFAPMGRGVQHSGGDYDVQRTLEELAALRDRGILSAEEFEAKKRELLKRI